MMSNTDHQCPPNRLFMTSWNTVKTCLGLATIKEDELFYKVNYYSTTSRGQVSGKRPRTAGWDCRPRTSAWFSVLAPLVCTLGGTEGWFQ